MRKLKTTDVFSFCRVIKQIGAKDKFREIAMKANSADDVFDSGFDLVWDLFDIATETNSEHHIYEFLAGPFEMKPAEIQDLDLDKLFPMLKQLAAENNLLYFFERAAALTK